MTFSLEKGGLSRREFLKGAGFGILASIFPERSLGALKDILDYEVKLKNLSYDKGIQYFYSQVFEDSRELKVFYFEADRNFQTKNWGKKEMQGGWYLAKNATRSDLSVRFELKNIEVLMKDSSDLKKITMLHTHPQKSSRYFYELFENNFDLKLSEDVQRILFLSSGDIFNLLANYYEFPQSTSKMSYELLEPSGHWKVKLNVDHKRTQGVFKALKEAKDIYIKEAQNKGINLLPEDVFCNGTIQEILENQLNRDWLAYNSAFVDYQIYLFSQERESRKNCVETVIEEAKKNLGIELEYFPLEKPKTIDRAVNPKGE